MPVPVAIVIPGIMGSELKLGERLIWPGPASSLILPYTLMDELLEPDLEATGIIRSFSISEQYNALIRDLTTCGFRLDAKPPTLRLFPYDWRKSIVGASERLAVRIGEIATEFRGECTISLIAHSMGGLVSRYYLESGRFDRQPGFDRIERLITMGTPHRGATLALQAILGQIRRLFLSREQVKRLANDPLYPSVYQLLPPSDEPFLWDEQATTGYEPLRLEDFADELHLRRSSLESAREFQSSLDVQKRPRRVRYFFCVGSTQTTACAALLLRRDKQAPRVRGVEQEDAGDGTVPISSGALTGIQSRPVGGEHGSIYKDIDLRATLAILLGYRGVLATRESVNQINVREPVVEPGDPVRVTLIPATAAQSIEGQLEFARFIEKNGTYVPTPAKPVVVTYSGPAAEKLSVVLKAPPDAGIYRLMFIERGAARPSATDDVFVQEPAGMELPLSITPETDSPLQ
ncbi:MAG TPA: hypothetical protein VLV78_04880 [Thermoanaerobaculia bacterium]|nr:hypothetical protein [Thermoanaerobaculia bacterium]